MASTTEEFWWSVNISFEETLGWNTLVTSYEDGKEQRRNKWGSPKRAYTISLRGRTKTVADQVWSFFNARKGALDSFYFKNPNENPVVAKALNGAVNSSNTTFITQNFPLLSGEPSAVYYDGTAIESSNYTITELTGTIEMNAAPSGSTAITADYNFARKVRFAEDMMMKELFNYQLYNSDFKLIEVL